MQTKPRSVILTYHSLDDSGSVVSISPSLFAQQMESLASLGAPVVPLEMTLSKPGSVAITFDDGYASFAEHALPVLARHRFPATLFVVSGHCGGRNNWPDQRPGAVPNLPLLSWKDLERLPPSIALGSHSVTHRDLSRLPEADCIREFTGCRDEIEHRTGRQVRAFAYPYGSSTRDVRTLAGKYYEFAAGTRLKFLSPKSDHLDLPRIDAYYLRGRFTIERLLTTAGAAYIQVRSALREIRRNMSRG